MLAVNYGFTEDELDFIPSTKLRQASLRLGSGQATTPSSTGWDETRRVKRNENETVSVMSSKPDHLIVENEKTKTLSGNIGLRVLF